MLAGVYEPWSWQVNLCKFKLSLARLARTNSLFLLFPLSFSLSLYLYLFLSFSLLSFSAYCVLRTAY